MNKLFVVISAVLLQIGLLTSCGDDDFNDRFGDNSEKVPTAVLDNFVALYPQAKNIDWEIKKDYAIVSFYLDEENCSKDDDHNATAWFPLHSGNWEMTELEMPFNALPASIKEAFSLTDYSKQPWRTDDEIEKLIRNNATTLYIIDVEKEENKKEIEMDLVYTEDGTLVKTILDDTEDNNHSDFLPVELNEKILSWLKVNYPNANVLDMDLEKEGIEIEILDGQIKRDIYFDLNSNWLYTETEIRYVLLPDIIKKAFEASQYATYKVDDVNEYKTNTNNLYYGLELESPTDQDFEIYISADGKTITDKIPW